MSEHKEEEHSTAHIIQSLAVNLAIAAVKAIAAYFTKSGSMLAEALHSFSDCGNQVLLLIGVRQARKPPDANHPLGYGRAIYFWSFLVALMLFVGGGVFSIYEGIHKIKEPEPVERVWLGIGILAVSLLLEGGATISNIRELNKRRGKKGFFQFLKDTTDSDLIVVFGENSAAVVGLALAIAALALAAVTNDGRWDGIGSAAIGLVLVAVAAFLATKVSKLLLGVAADPEVTAEARKIVKDMPELERILNVLAMQQGPGEVLLHIKIAFQSHLTISEACRAINVFEERLRAARPEVKWVYVEPDIPKEAPANDSDRPPKPGPEEKAAVEKAAADAAS